MMFNTDKNNNVCFEGLDIHIISIAASQIVLSDSLR